MKDAHKSTWTGTERRRHIEKNREPDPIQTNSPLGGIRGVGLAISLCIVFGGIGLLANPGHSSAKPNQASAVDSVATPLVAPSVATPTLKS